MKKTFNIILFIISIIIINSCIDTDSEEIVIERRKLEVKLKKELDKAFISFQEDSIFPIIDFAELTEFKWDSAYIYERTYGQPYQLINRCEWRIVKNVPTHVSTDNFIVCFFLRNDTVIQYISIRTTLINNFIFESSLDIFNISHKINSFSYEKAKFDVNPFYHNNNKTTQNGFILRDTSLGFPRKFVEE